ncbi:MAG: carboxypeptidase regulatory-like domain-containing protein [Gemmataceae bacterium]
MNTAVAGVLTTLLLGAAPPRPAGAEMRFRVVDEERCPVAGASVYASIWAGNNGGNRNYTTDADGVAMVRRPNEVDLMRIWVSKPGHAGLFRGWEKGTHDQGRGLPKSFTFQLNKATTVGGRVVDEKGRGVAGARVEAQCEVDGAKKLPDGVAYHTTLAYGAGAAVTDKDGRWKLENVPVPASSFSLRIAHPEYVSDTRDGGLQQEQGVTTAQLRAGEAVVRLAAGGRVAGSVTDAAGKPVAGALVVFDDNAYYGHGRQEVRTDKQGNYSLPTLKPGRHPVTVIARGYMPQRREVDLKAGRLTEDFRLGPGKALRVKVVDEAGKPVQASFTATKWRGSEAIRPWGSTGIPHNTNADGVYVWDWAPADAVVFWVFAKGLQTRMNLPLTAGEGAQTLVMRRVPAVAGRVTDAKTGKPVGKFRVYRVIEFGSGTFVVERREPIDGKAGVYHTLLERDDVDYRLLVEADGYRTALSRPSLVKGKAKEVDFALEPAAPVRGRILGPDGTPLAEARVSLATAVQDFTYPERDTNLTAVTDKAGVFTLPAQAHRFVLFVDHPQGSARLDRLPDQSVGDVTARPWASVRGVLWQDGKPVPGQTVFLRPLERRDPDAPRVWTDQQVRTDKAGAFSFANVPAGPLTVSAYLGPWEPSPLTSSESVALDPKPGESVRLDLGKTGATLRGTIKLDGDLPKGLDLTYSLNWLTRKTPDVVTPHGLDLRKDGRRLLLSREEGVNSHRRFFVKPTPEGRFRIVGVPPGEYWFTTQVFEKPDG